MPIRPGGPGAGTSPISGSPSTSPVSSPIDRSGATGDTFGGPRGPGGGGHHGGPGADPVVSFTFSTDSSSVTAMTVGDGTRSRTVDITGDTFKTTVGTNDLGSTAVLSVQRTHTSTSHSDVDVFSDQDGNAQFSRVFGIDVLTATSDKIETHAYTYATDGSIATDVETRGDHTHTESTGTNVKYQIVKLEGDTYVVRTETLSNSDVRFEITRDDNGDGKWTTLAHGEVDAAAAATYVDTTTGNLKLVGVIDYLHAADAIVG